MQEYSDEFLYELAEYLGGPDQLEFESQTRVEWSAGLLNAIASHIDMHGKDFLDAGCGHGPLALCAHNLGMRVSAFDFLPRAVELANMRFRDTGAPIVAKLHDLRDAVPDEHKEAYDLVANFQVLEHLPRSSQFVALRNLCEMVKPGGFLFIDTENSLYPYDRHDTFLPLVRLLAPAYQKSLVRLLGRGLNMKEPSYEEVTYLHDYLSYDEIVGAVSVMGFKVVDPATPHGSTRQRFLSLTGSDWFYESIGQYFEIERFMPVSALFQKV